jgi:hypothetical protein
MLRVMGLVLGAFVLCAAPAQAATVTWLDDPHSGPIIDVQAGANEDTDLVVRGEQGTHGRPNVVTIGSRLGTLTSDVPRPAPGACDGEALCTVPCRIEAPRRVSCRLADGFTSDPPPLNPLERRPGFSYVGLGVAGGARSRITVPEDNPVNLELRQAGGGTPSSQEWNISNATASSIEVVGGTVIRSGYRGRVSAVLWGPVRVRADNGSADSFVCPTEEPYHHTMRLDVFDHTGNCYGDISPPPSWPTVPAPPQHPAEVLP